MNRYDIILGKTPPKRPRKKKPVKVLGQDTIPSNAQGQTGIVSDAVDQIFGPLESITPNAVPNDQNGVIAQYVRTAEGRARLAASMMAPLQNRVNAGSLARRIFLVDPLVDGQLPLYDLNPSGTYVMGADNNAGRVVVNSCEKSVEI